MRKIIFECDSLSFSLLESFLPKEKMLQYITKGYDKLNERPCFKIDVEGNKSIVVRDKDGRNGSCIIKIQDE